MGVAAPVEVPELVLEIPSAELSEMKCSIWVPKDKKELPDKKIG